MGKDKGEDLIGQILTAQHQRSHGGFWERNSNLWDDSVRSPSPFPSPAPDSRKNLLADYTQVQECAKRPSVDTELLMGVCQRKLRKAKVLSERIGVEESFFAMPARSPRHAGVTGKELEIRVWQNLEQLVGGWEGGTELE